MGSPGIENVSNAMCKSETTSKNHTIVHDARELEGKRKLHENPGDSNMLGFKSHNGSRHEEAICRVKTVQLRVMVQGLALIT